MAPRKKPDPIDLLAEFALGEQAPQPIALGDLTVNVRRTFTGMDVIRFGAATASNDFEQALDVITDNAAAVWKLVQTFSSEHAAKVLNRIVEIAGIHEGELVAPLPASALVSAARMVGAQLTQDSDATTD